MPKLRKKEETDLMTILSKFSPKKMSNGQIRCECPFRENHTDGSGKQSFFFSPDKNAYHCFSCRAKGNMVKLLTTRFGVGFYTATELVTMTSFEEERKQEEEFELDVRWNFNKSPKEFLQRGHDPKILRKFRVGETLDNGNIFIPFYDDFSSYNELLGYQVRWYSPNRGVRNSVRFDKAHYLYNLDYSEEYVVVVEGSSDVWRLAEFGYNAVALLGADINEFQADKLSKFKKVYLAFDNDLAGRKVTEKAHFLLKNLTEVLLVPYTTKDPGEVDKVSWDVAFQNSTDYATYVLEMTVGWEDYEVMRRTVIKEMKKRSQDL